MRWIFYGVCREPTFYWNRYRLHRNFWNISKTLDKSWKSHIPYYHAYIVAASLASTKLDSFHFIVFLYRDTCIWSNRNAQNWAWCLSISCVIYRSPWETWLHKRAFAYCTKQNKHPRKCPRSGHPIWNFKALLLLFSMNASTISLTFHDVFHLKYF